MTEIITISFGQAGIRIGEQFWKEIKEQHQLDSSDPKGLMNFFQESSSGWKSRSLFVSLDQREADKLRTNSKDFHHPNNIISTQMPTFGNFGQTCYHVYPKISDEIEQSIRRSAETCDHLSGLIYNSTLGGSTASGIGSNLQKDFRNLFSCKSHQYYRLLPNFSEASHPLQIYNCAFAMKQDLQNCDFNYLYDNSYAYRGLAKRGEFRPTIQRVNEWLGSAMAKMTAPFRFSGQLNTNQRKIATNLVVFPRLHYSAFSINTKKSLKPLQSALDFDHFSLREYFDRHLQMKMFGLYAGLSHNQTSQNEIVKTVSSQFSKRHLAQFSCHVSISDQITEEPKARVVINSQHMGNVFKDLSKQFNLQYGRRAYMNSFLEAGIDQYEFQSVKYVLQDIFSQYSPSNDEEIESNEYVDIDDIQTFY